MGRMICDLFHGKVFSGVSKTFSVCGRENSSLSSPSSLNCLQVSEIVHFVKIACDEIILPFLGVILPILPDRRAAITTDSGCDPSIHNILKEGLTMTGTSDTKDQRFDPLRTIVPKNGSRPRPIGKFGSVSEAARKLGLTRQQVKWLLDPKPGFPGWRA